MSQAYQHILELAKALPRQEQFTLVEALLAQIKGDVLDPSGAEPSPGETEALFRELDRRLAALRSGEVSGIPGESVMARLK
jgi:putative addiction module component (TIGR02574 family)